MKISFGSSMPPASPSPRTSTITFAWLLHLRWGAIVGQALLIYLVGTFSDIIVPIPLVSAILAFEIISNLLFRYLQKKEKHIPSWLFGCIMLSDLILLTVLLVRTGGAMNPFTFLYLLHVVIGAILMRPIWSWTLALFTVLCYSSLFLSPAYIDFSTLGSHEISGPVCVDVAKAGEETDTQMRLHLQGMLVAFAVTTLFIVFFIGKIRQSLEKYYETENQLFDEKVKSEKLAALATLAAGAAHEFSTPLATIAVATGEMLHYGGEHGIDSRLLDDLHLIKNQVATCKEILDQLSADAGEQRGEPGKRFRLEDLLDEIVEALPEERFEQLTVDNLAGDPALYGPFQTLSRVIRGLVKNSFDATPFPGPQVILRVEHDRKHLQFTVVDQGSGMNFGTRARATEPFYTTKETGKGMGLGLFLARSVAERFGGALVIDSEEGRGSTITFRLLFERVNGEKR